MYKCLNTFRHIGQALARSTRRASFLLVFHTSRAVGRVCYFLFRGGGGVLSGTIQKVVGADGDKRLNTIDLCVRVNNRSISAFISCKFIVTIDQK